MRQLKFQLSKTKDVFGGSLLKGNARAKRPLNSKLPLHLVLRAAPGKSMRHPKVYLSVNQTVTRIARKYGFTIYKYANVGNHLHLVIRLPRRQLWAPFIRELTGRVAQVAQGLKGRVAGEQRFWLTKPFTRVVRGWRQAFRSVIDYVMLNQWEAEGFVRRADFKRFRDLRVIWDAPA